MPFVATRHAYPDDVSHLRTSASKIWRPEDIPDIVFDEQDVKVET
jgi:hypothetical protein